jgi:hypothetical protein
VKYLIRPSAFSSTFRSSSRSFIGVVVAVALGTLALVGAIPATARAASVAPEGEAKEVTIYLPSPTNHRFDLELRLFPAEGVAVVDTYQRVGYEALRGVAYAIAIPPVPFSGSIDLSFPGLGSVVGTVTPYAPQTSAARAKARSSKGISPSGAPAVTRVGGLPRSMPGSSWHAVRSLRRKTARPFSSVTFPKVGSS